MFLSFDDWLQYPGGILVDPSGSEHSFLSCIEQMLNMYGDHKNQGNKLKVWVDRVSASQMGPDMWFVKFDKWESCGGSVIIDFSLI